MKKFLFTAVFCFVLSFGSTTWGEQGSVVLEPAADEPKTQEITMPVFIRSVIELGKYFNETYPGGKINEDFSDDVARLFPSLSRQEVYDREQNIRDAIKVYRFFSDVYRKVKEKMLVPEAPPLVVPDEDYEVPGSGPEYVESEDLVVVQDFKKVLPYGSNPRDFNAYAAKMEREFQKQNPRDDFEKLGRLFTKLDWKKLPFYGIIYENPFTGGKGGGAWDERQGVRVRLITEHSTVENKELLGAVHVIVPEDRYILASPTDGLQAPVFSFRDSQNLDSVRVYYPVPARVMNEKGGDRAAYYGNFAFPVRLAVKDSGKELLWKTEVALTICSAAGECRREIFRPELTLGTGEGYFTSFNNFIIQSYNLSPKENNPSFSLEKAVADETEDGGQVLRLEFDADELPLGFDVFVDGPSDIKFKRPRIAVNGSRIVARLETWEPGVRIDGRELTVTARLSPLENLRRTVVVKKASPFDFAPEKLSWGLILFGILGGLLLNFMPCVFPVLSVKILSLSKFGAENDRSVRRNFMFTAAGIFLALGLIAVVLAVLKMLGRTVGWGMQFQSPVFLVFMMFVIVAFIAVLSGKITIRAPGWLERLDTGANGFMHFLTGVLVVLMATPCTAPYLGTAVGFALGSAYVSDIFIIMFSVALGLSLPYLLLALIPDAAFLFPKPGAWMRRLNAFMGIMLFLTLVWLLSILYAQSSFGVCARLSVCLLLFYLLISLRRVFMEHLDYQKFELWVRKGVEKLINISAAVLFALLFAFAVWDAVSGLSGVQKQRMEDREKVIDYDRISQKVKSGKMVIVAVGADWCLTCRYNDITVFSNLAVENLLKRSGTELITVDWTEYNPEVLEFMKKYGRFGLPFYVIFSPMIPDGMVLPEVLSERELSRILKDMEN